MALPLSLVVMIVPRLELQSIIQRKRRYEPYALARSSSSLTGNKIRSSFSRSVRPERRKLIAVPAIERGQNGARLSKF